MRLIIWKDGNRSVIPANRLEREDSMMFAYLDGKCVGMFDLGCFDALYLSEGKSERSDKECEVTRR